MSASRVALLSVSPDLAQGDGISIFPSYGVRRIQAALSADPLLADTHVELIDERCGDAERFLERLLAFEPDVVGASVYVWSTPTMIEVASRFKRMRPEVTFVFGGPSARPAVFDLPPYRDTRHFVDALVISDGEETFRELVRLPDRTLTSLARVPGLMVSGNTGWSQNEPRVPDPDLDTVASPAQRGLMPSEQVGYVETFRGCPFSCLFCQWGAMDSKRRFSTEYLVRELHSIKASKPRFTYLVDAGLNLNLSAFRNLAAAEREVGLFSESPLICEVYPHHLTDEHMRFLESTRHVHFGVGVQSLHDTTLSSNNRPFKPANLRPIIEQLSRFGLIDVEIILGLPDDTPEAFRETLETVLELPCSVRVFRCLVLPDALLTRGESRFDIHFDPLTLEMQSCNSWPEKALRETQEYVTRLSESWPGGLVGDFWWHFRSGLPGYAKAYGAVS